MNGANAALHLPLPTDPPVQSAKAAAIEAQAPTQLEQSIGDAVADAAGMICIGIGDWAATGGLSAANRTSAGELFVQLYQLQEEARLPDEAFDAILRAEGRQADWALGVGNLDASGDRPAKIVGRRAPMLLGFAQASPWPGAKAYRFV
jgi:hypothetical protein